MRIAEKTLRGALLVWALSGGAAATLAAPDEEALGREQGYPVAPRLGQAFQEAYKVGSFTAMDRLSPHCELPAAEVPLRLTEGRWSQPFAYTFNKQSFNLDDYMQHQRATAVLVLKDGAVVAERLNYGRTPDMRYLSNSMSKTVLALGIMKALETGAIRQLTDTAATYVPELTGSLYGETSLLHLLRMSSGARFTENYSGQDDNARFHQQRLAKGTVAAAKGVTERLAPAGERFNYASIESYVLGLVLRGATHRTVCEFVGQYIWQPMGAESRASWLITPLDKVEQTGGYFNATLRDYARLGWLMANDGTVNGQTVLSRQSLLAMTDPLEQPEYLRPGKLQINGSTYLGYGLHTWLLPGSSRRFVLLGIHGQAIYVDPALKLVMVHLAVAKDAAGDASGSRMPAERDALWRAWVAYFGGRW